MTDSRAEARVGTVLHEKWTLERLLGVGGMGAVYAARHRNGARAAVKVLSPESGRLPYIRKRFLHEGYAANRVEHPNAVKVLDDDVIQDGPDEGTAYLVMELLDGESLQERAKREPKLTERDLLDIADGILGVLEAAHANGVVHRDLKPDNLFLTHDDSDRLSVKVLDFGLARLLEIREQTIQGMALGTPSYMSPEQAAGQVDDIDGRTDIYALGSILFQLATNQRIHEAAHTLGVVIRMATQPAPKTRSVAADVSEPFAEVVDKALEFKREDRYANATEMRKAVRSAIEALGGVPRSERSVAIAPTVAAPVPASAMPAIPVAETPRSVPEPTREAPAPEAPPDRPTRIEPAIERSQQPPQKRSSLFGMFLVLFVLGSLGVIVWKNHESLSRALTAATASMSASVPGSGPSALPEQDASIELGDISDASAAAAPGPADAAADAGDDDDEDDDEDASVPDASAKRLAPKPFPAKPHPSGRPPRVPGKPPKRKHPKK